MTPTDQAIVLVGGRGTRLRSVVSDVPKPLAPVAGRSFLSRLLDRLEDAGVRHVVLASGYMADVIERAIGSTWGNMKIGYSVEEAPLGTGGAIRQALSHLRVDHGVHVLNGDTWLEYDLSALSQTTAGKQGARIGMALAWVDEVSRYGAVEVDAGRVCSFLEKGASGPGFINAGCYFLEPSLYGCLPDALAFPFEQSVLEPQVALGAVAAYTRTSGFIDIGVPEDYARAQGLFGDEAAL